MNIRVDVEETHHRKTPEIYDILVQNDIPIPPEYHEMDCNDRIEGIIKGEIHLVELFAVGETYCTVHYPGKEPVNHRARDIGWHLFYHRLKGLGEAALRDGYPVLILGILSLSQNSPPRCKCCGLVCSKPSGKTIPFCDDTDCRKKYLKFRDLLKKLVKEGKITEFEREVRMNTGCVIEDTKNGSWCLVCQLMDEAAVDDEPYTPISRNFIVTPDLDIVFADKTCEWCGVSFAGNKQARFCSDNCRYQYHNEKKKKLSD